MEQYPSINLAIEVKQQQDELVLVYTLSNSGDKDFGILNGITRMTPDGKDFNFDSSNAYISLEANVLTICQMIMPIPEGVHANERPIPSPKLLQARGTFQRKLKYSLPIQVYQPYQAILLKSGRKRMTAKPQKQRWADEVWLSIGLFEIKNPDDLQEVPGYPGEYRANPTAASQGQFVLTAKVKLPEPIPVLDYELVPR